ncbi:MAG: hypothetical protein K6B64_03865, partial [Acholeplasmatales bacterium]|nr:hypothetical protein [Acholeplasmatales bacterium]
MISCSNSTFSQIKNNSFEVGTIESWTSTGNAFTNECISFDSKSVDGENLDYDGDYFLYGKKAPLGSTGVLESNPFTLSGNGKISFLIGAG